MNDINQKVVSKNECDNNKHLHVPHDTCVDCTIMKYQKIAADKIIHNNPDIKKKMTIWRLKKLGYMKILTLPLFIIIYFEYGTNLYYLFISMFFYGLAINSIVNFLMLIF